MGYNGYCARTQDCEPGQYCGEGGRCRDVKGEYAGCTHKYECGRTASCLFNRTNNFTGLCVSYFSVPTGN